MTKIAWIFPGQGSQTVGMGTDLKDLPIAQNLLAQADKILGWSILDITQADEKKLSRTLYTQPCLYVIECILVDMLLDKQFTPDFVAGHSLGEYVALYAAGVFDFEAGLKLVARRAALMDESVGGVMAALMKFDREKLELELKQIPNVVIANDNSPEQVVISGTKEAVEALLSKVSAKRSVILKVSGAFHSHFMINAAEEFQKILDTVSFKKASFPVCSNVDPTPTTDPAELKQRLGKQMTGSVRWREFMLQLPSLSVSKVVEVGPGKVLTGLVKRTCPEIELQNIAGITDF